MSHLFEDLKIEVSRSPEVALFVRLRENWDTVLKDPPYQDLSLDGVDDEAKLFIVQLKEELGEVSAAKVDYLRDDYRELLELALLFTSEDSPPTFSFKRPGALHKARWMARLIYILKAVLLEDRISDLPRGTITSQAQLPKLRSFAMYTALVYCKWWFQCSVTVDAPLNMLNLMKDSLKYAVVDKAVSDSVIKSLNRHLWYLVPEMIPLALFSLKVTAIQKSEIASKLVSLKPSFRIQVPRSRYGNGFGKPSFPQEVTVSSKLSDFVSEDSWLLFQLLEVEGDFLKLPVSEWLDQEDYLTAAEKANAVNAVNDVAERAVKLGTDFQQAARTESHYQNIIQVVEANRQDMPNLRKI